MYKLLIISLLFLAGFMSGCKQPARYVGNNSGWYYPDDPNIPEGYICVSIEDLAEIFE